MTIQLQQNQDPVLNEIAQTQNLCAQLMKTPHYAKMGAEGIFAITQKAKSIGMSPLDALNGGMYFVKGKVEMSGQSMLAVIRSKGHSVSMDPKSTDTKVIMYGKRADNSDTWRVEFSIEDAKQQGIYQNQWLKMPKVMCMWRCVSQLSRFLFSDVIKGIYVQGGIADALPFEQPVNFETGEIIEEVKEEILTITNEQAFELEDLISDCSEEDKMKFNNFLKSNNFKSVKEIPAKSFENLRLHTIKRKAEHQQSKNTSVYSMEESIMDSE
jgi:hypothetical protein